ncbi:MAG: acyltransferase family protein [Muribaculaceae bacterium]|nr:acyltransferase family protein [Muribaculaceae bacterium]MBR6431275.1 acyltransferase family protein [Muribaculaceae bacterium]
MDATKGKTRLATLDIARIVCIILVVIGHYDPVEAPAHYNNMLKVIYTFHMPVFLFISGFLYIITQKQESFKAFFIKKINRLAIPYLVTSAIIITIKLLSQGNARVDHPVTAWSYLKMFYIPEAGYFLWFIIALFVMFAVVYFFKSKQARLILFLISFVISLLPSCGIDILCLRQTQEMMVYFMTGVLVADYAPEIIKTGLVPTLIILLVFIGCETYYVQHQDSVVMYKILPFVGIASVMTMCHNCESYIPVLARSCVVLAPSVYIIYLFHTTILGFAKAFFSKIPFFSNNIDSTFYLQAFCAIACGAIVPIVLYYIIKRFKILRLLFGV